MKRLDYLKLALKNRAYVTQDWIIRCFAIMRPKTETELAGNTYYLMPVLLPFAYGFINEENIFVKFDEDLDVKQPLFSFSERLTIDNTWADNVKQPTETCIGNLLVNAITVLECFGSKFPFQTGSLSMGNFESLIVEKLKDTPKTETERSAEYFYVDEYVKFINAMSYIRDFSHIVSISATRKNIRKPDGIEAFKKQLLVKYDGKLTNPVELSKFEGELKAFDDAYMADDPSNNKFVKGKIKNIARKKLFLTLGQGLSFNEGGVQNPIVGSLSEGWSTDPKDITAMVNDARMASYYRGSETVKGGVSAKTLLRAANNFKIWKDRSGSPTDCGSKLGLKRFYTSGNISQLPGKTLLLGPSSKLIENDQEAGPYLGKILNVRSPMYCTLSGDVICEVCAGKKLSTLPTGLSIPLTEISAIIMTSSMKRMHGVVLSTAKITLEDHFS
jgi:hypothetical protein